MASRYALIQNGKVVNTINADANYVALIENDWDHVVDISNIDPTPQLGWDYDGENFVAVDAPPPSATFESRSTHAVDKGNTEDQSISGEEWILFEAKRVLWDFLGEYNLTSSTFPITQSGVYNFDIQTKLTNLTNVGSIELALFKVEDGADDYWFKLDMAYPSVDQTEVSMGGSTQFDFYLGEEYYVAIKLSKRVPELDCSAVISGSDDYTAWGSSWNAPLVNAYRG